MRISIAVLAALVGLAFAAPVLAQEPDRENRRQKLLERFDEDGDGKLSEEERAKMKEALDERRGRKHRRGGEGGRRRGGDEG